MTTPISQEMDDAIRGNDIGDFIDQIWANASRRAVAASPSSPFGSDPSGLPSLSQDNREPGDANNAPGSNQ